MPGRHRRNQARSLALVVGGTVGALLRYALATAWPLPHQMLVSTVLTVGGAFTIAAFLLATNAASLLAYMILGFCGSAASLSAWAVLTISAPMKLSLAFLLGTPAAAIGGLFCGLVMARAVAR